MIESEDFLRDPELITGGPVRVVVPISGGKDSQACMKLAVTEGSSGVIGLFCDTQFEHPWTYEHVDRISELYGVSIVRVCDGSVPSVVVRTGSFPTGARRLCTDRLKIVPSKKFYEGLAVRQGSGFQVWIGIRSGESKKRNKSYSLTIGEDLYLPHEAMPTSYFPKKLATLGVRFRFPIVDWEEDDVFTYLSGTHNPLYNHGMKRVGCFPCLASSDKRKLADFMFDDFGRQQYALVRELEEVIDKQVFDNPSYARSMGMLTTDSTEQYDEEYFQGCSFCAM